jgi:CRISPR-associated protein Cst1
MREDVRMDGEMNKTSEEILFQFTGNPFVDAGIWAICEWVGKTDPEDLDKEDLKSIVTDIVPLYFEKGWRDSMQSIFPNNPIINPSLPKDLKNKPDFEKYRYKKKKYNDYLHGLLEEIVPLNSSGACISCGRRNVKTVRTKTEIPLIGSGSLINYFPNGQSGGDYCPACTFAVQFAPLVMYSCVKLLLLHSNSDKVMRYWARRAIHDIRRQMLERDYSGCFNENYKNPRNALFHSIQEIIRGYDARWSDENPSITLYHFTNYNQGPDLDLYYVPTQVFRFLAYMRQHEKYPQWMQIVRKGYVRVDWDKVKEEGDYKNKINAVYNNLLSDKSIVRFFIDLKERRVYGDWDLLSYYLEEVRSMEKERLETLKRVGDEVANYIRETENIKRLGQLEQASNYGTFRNILRLVIKDRVKMGAKDPLFSLDEYVNDLFPDGNLGWRETQDLLLFRLYENLHDWLVEQKEGIEELTVEETVVEE